MSPVGFNARRSLHICRVLLYR